MKKIIFGFFLLLTAFYSKAQQYTQYVPFDSTITTGYFVPSSDCSDNFQCKIGLDASLYTYVSGLHFYVIIDSVYFPGPFAPVHAGDTTFLDAAHPQFSILAVSGLQVWYSLKLSGIPSVASESYPCKIEWTMCTCFCADQLIKASTSAPSLCTVDLSNSLTETNHDKAVAAYPNPANTSISLKNNTGKATIDIYNIYGELVLKTQSYNANEIDINSLRDGVYYLSVLSEGHQPSFIKIIISR